MVNRPEIIALIIIGLTLFLLVKYTAVQAWHVLVILVAGFLLAVYVPQIPSLISSVAGWLSSHASSLTHHKPIGARTRPGPPEKEKHAHEDH